MGAEEITLREFLELKLKRFEETQTNLSDSMKIISEKLEKLLAMQQEQATSLQLHIQKSNNLNERLISLEREFDKFKEDYQKDMEDLQPVMLAAKNPRTAILIIAGAILILTGAGITTVMAILEHFTK